MLRNSVLLVVALALAGCSGSNNDLMPTAPSAISPAAPLTAPAVAVTSELRGFVFDTAFRPLAGARVEVVDGPSAGVAAVADSDGQIVLSGTFDAATRFRATKDGHEARTQPWSCSTSVPCLGSSGARPWLGFYLTVLEPSVNIAGNYLLTFTADSTCADLPAGMRTRSYRATATARPSDGRSATPGFELQVSGASFVGTLSGFPIGVAGNQLNLWLHGGHDPAIVEQVGTNTYLAFSGTAITSVAASAVSTITAALDGWIEHVVLRSAVGPWYYPQDGVVSKATCESRNHRIALTRVN